MNRPDTSAFLPHELRVVEERSQLLGRLAALTCFIGTDAFKALDKEDQVLLREQYAAMHTLDGILGRRIERFAVSHA